MNEKEWKEICISTLRSSAFVMVNKKIMEAVGLPTASFLSVLMDKDFYHSQQNALTEDGFFYETIESMEKLTKLTRYEQDGHIHKLQEKHLIETVLRGLPARRHFKILYENISLILKQVCKETANFEIPTTYVKETNGTVCKDTTNLFAENLQQIKTEDKNKSMSDTPCIAKPSVLHLKKKIMINRNAPLVVKEESTPHPDKKPRIFKHLLKSPQMTDDVREIIDYWISKGFTAHRQHTQSEAKVINDIKALFEGTAFVSYRDKGYTRSYTVKEIKRSIDNFALCALSPDHEPVSIKSKQFLQSIRLCDFFYNPRIGTEADKSMFLKHLFNKPNLISNSKVFAAKDGLPHVTKILLNWYKQKFGNRDNGSFSIQDRNKIVYCGRNLQQFIEDNKEKLRINSEWKRIYGQYDDTAFLAVQLTRALDKELRDNESLYSVFHSGWLTSEKTFTERLPKFLRSESIMK